MTTEQWTAVDDDLEHILLAADPVLEATLRTAAEARLPAISVSPLQGRMLELLVRATGARRVLEIGTLGGYSAICLARGLAPDGRLVTLEFSPHHAQVATANIERAGLAGLVEVRVGDALQTLPALEAEGAGPFDMVFIDADKAGYLAYLDWALRLTRPGSLILADNVVRDGRVTHNPDHEPTGEAVRRYLERVAAEPRLRSTAIQTVGCKGWDGLSIAVVVA